VAKTIADIGQRRAIAIRVKQDLISCLTRCGERLSPTARGKYDRQTAATDYSPEYRQLATPLSGEKMICAAESYKKMITVYCFHFRCVTVNSAAA